MLDRGDETLHRFPFISKIAGELFKRVGTVNRSLLHIRTLGQAAVTDNIALCTGIDHMLHVLFPLCHIFGHAEVNAAVVGAAEVQIFFPLAVKDVAVDAERLTVDAVCHSIEIALIHKAFALAVELECGRKAEGTGTGDVGQRGIGAGLHTAARPAAETVTVTAVAARARIAGGNIHAAEGLQFHSLAEVLRDHLGIGLERAHGDHDAGIGKELLVGAVFRVLHDRTGDLFPVHGQDRSKVLIVPGCAMLDGILTGELFARAERGVGADALCDLIQDLAPEAVRTHIALECAHIAGLGFVLPVGIGAELDIHMLQQRRIFLPNDLEKVVDHRSGVFHILLDDLGLRVIAGHLHELRDDILHIIRTIAERVDNIIGIEGTYIFPVVEDGILRLGFDDGDLFAGLCGFLGALRTGVAAAEHEHIAGDGFGNLAVIDYRRFPKPCGAGGAGVNLCRLAFYCDLDALSLCLGDAGVDGRFDRGGSDAGTGNGVDLPALRGKNALDHGVADGSADPLGFTGDVHKNLFDGICVKGHRDRDI